MCGEKQSLCYYCGASAVRSTGVMVVDCGVEPGGEAKAEAAIRKELEDMCREPVTAEEMEQCRLSMLGSIDAVGDSLGALESWYYGAFLRGEDPITPEEGKALTAAVTAEQVRQLMRSYHYSVCYTDAALDCPELTIREKAAAAAGCRRAVLPSGLTVLCRTMPDYSTVHAMYATAFGSTVRDFVLDGTPVHLPAGTAHFLEHKMFESEQGDAFALYAKTGASANAFTSWDHTCYLFSATNRTDENLDILLTWWAIPGSHPRPSPRSRESSARRSECTTTAPTGA